MQEKRKSSLETRCHSFGRVALFDVTCDQLWYVMTSSASHGNALILSGTEDSIGGIIILYLKINPVCGIGLVSELFDSHTYFTYHDLKVNTDQIAYPNRVGWGQFQR